VQCLYLILVECLQSLSFESLTARQENVAPALADTFNWIWSSGFEKFLASGHGIYWILGKPGCGKSTLLKYLAESPQVMEILKGRVGFLRTTKPVVAAHFLDFKGQDPLARSMEGLLRSLLWQTLKSHPASFEQALPAYEEMRRTRVGVVWSRHVLTNILKGVLQHISAPVCIFIDALDEYLENDTEEHRDRHIEIADFFDDLAKSLPANIRICLSSRPYPEFTIQFCDTPQLQLHRLISNDIRLYIRSRFKPITGINLTPHKNQEAMEDIINHIITKAEGIFLWVKLVCDALLRGWRKAESIEKLQQHLGEMPEKISSLYQRIIEELDCTDRIEAWSMLGIVASAIRPLSLSEFSYSLPNAQFTSTQHLHRRIDAICGGLLEVKFGKVRLCHETVFAYLLNHQVHVLRDGNVYLLRACTSTLSRLEKTVAGSIECEEICFLRYSTLNWLEHACRAKDYTGSLEPRAWEQLSNLQFLLWYELFLCISWELPSIRMVLNYQFSIARLQQIVLVYNFNLALAVRESRNLEVLMSPLPVPIVGLSSATEQPADDAQRFIMETGSGICVLSPINPIELSHQEHLSCFVEVDGQTFSSVQSALDASELSLAERSIARGVHPAYLPDWFGSADVDPSKRSADHEVLLPARHSDTLKSLNQIEMNSAGSAKGITPLQLSAFHGLYSVLETLLLNQANVNLEAGASFGTPLIASICGIAELLHPKFARSEPVFSCFDMLLFKEADPNKAAFGADIGGVKTPLEVSFCVLLNRIEVIKSFGNSVNVLEDIRCANMIYVIDKLLDSGAQPNLEVQRDAKKHQQVWLLFEGKVSFILKPGNKSVDDAAVISPRLWNRLVPSEVSQYQPRRNSITSRVTPLEADYHQFSGPSSLASSLRPPPILAPERKSRWG